MNRLNMAGVPETLGFSCSFCASYFLLSIFFVFFFFFLVFFFGFFFKPRQYLDMWSAIFHELQYFCSISSWMPENNLQIHSLSYGGVACVWSRVGN